MNLLTNSFYGEMHTDDGNMLTKFQVNLIYNLRDMDKLVLLQECSKIATRMTRIATKA